MGKAYANKKKKEDRPVGDYYSTPQSLIWVAKDIIQEEFQDNPILEPCSGNNAIYNALPDYYITTNDLYNEKAQYSYDYTKQDIFNEFKYIITNPPFSIWDDFVNKAKTHCKKFMFLGRLNYFGTQSRLEKNLWKNLKVIFPFSRYVDYQTPYREDGHFHVGAMATGWFLFDMNYEGKPTIEVLDVQKYATLGAFKKKKKGDKNV